MGHDVPTVSRAEAGGGAPNAAKRRGDPAVDRAAAGVRLYAQLGLRVPEELALRLKRHCKASGKSVNRTVMEALDRYLGDNGR